MSEECTHDCSSCTADCGERQQSFIEKPHEGSNIKKVIGVVSGKGGVGKSMVTSLLSVLMNRKGFKTAIMDADLTGPSIPKCFGINNLRCTAEENAEVINPVSTTTGIKVVSLNLLLEEETMPVIWRGPVIAGVVKQFWTDTNWGDVDYMFVDMPPGTGDVPLTVFQSIPLDGIIIVTSPQELVSMIVAKAFNMASMMNVPVLGLVENMSYALCPDCGKKIEIFGASKVKETANEFGIFNSAQMPIDTKLAAACDAGAIELFEGDWLDKMADMLEILSK